MATKPRAAEVIRHPAAEPPICADRELHDLLAKVRRLDGTFWPPLPTPAAPSLRPSDAALLAALRRWRATPADAGYAAAVARQLVASYPIVRVGGDAFAAGFADIVADDRISPDIARHVARRVRATERSLPPLAELRDRMLAETRERERLLVALETYEDRWRDHDQLDHAEAARIAERAARHGLHVEPADIVAAWHGLAENWLHDRDRDPPRTDSFVIDHALNALAAGIPVAAAVAALLPRLAAYHRQRAANIAATRDLPEGSAEAAEWYRAWPPEEDRFAAELDAIATALRLAGAGPEGGANPRGGRGA